MSGFLTCFTICIVGRPVSLHNTTGGGALWTGAAPPPRRCVRAAGGAAEVGGPHAHCVHPKLICHKFHFSYGRCQFRHKWKYVTTMLIFDGGIYCRVRRDPDFVAKWQTVRETKRSYWNWWSSRGTIAALTAPRLVRDQFTGSRCLGWRAYLF